MDSTPRPSLQFHRPKASSIGQQTSASPTVPSSPASSTSPPTSVSTAHNPSRRSSVHPTMDQIRTRQRESTHGFNFFDDGSSDSDDADNGRTGLTEIFLDVNAFDVESVRNDQQDDRSREWSGKKREKSKGNQRPISNAFPVDRKRFSFEDEHVSSSDYDSGTRKARKLSMKRLGDGNARLVHTRSNASAARIRRRSSMSEAALSISEPLKMFLSNKVHEKPPDLPRNNSFNYHQKRISRKNTIGSLSRESPTLTVSALEPRSPPKSLLQATEESSLRSSIDITMSKLYSSGPDHRLISSSPLLPDDNRPTRLPNQNMERIDADAARKEFLRSKPKPQEYEDMKPREIPVDEVRGIDKFCYGDLKPEYDNRKGMNVLGLGVSEGPLDLRSRLERNQDAQGVIRSGSHSSAGREALHGVVWLSLLRRSWAKTKRGEASRKLLRMPIPDHLTRGSPERKSRGRSQQEETEFDDEQFAVCLQVGHGSLSGNWFRRTLSARILKYIRPGQSRVWGGGAWQDVENATSAILRIGEGVPNAPNTRMPRTEAGLFELYEKPTVGRGSYTWVQWARWLAACNEARQESSCGCDVSAHSCPTCKQVVHHAQKGSPGPMRNSNADLPFGSGSKRDTITTIEFVHELSTRRVVSVLVLMLTLSMFVALAWIFLGGAEVGWKLGSSKQLSDRVGSGMAIAVSALLFEGIGFGAWLLFS